MTALLAALAVSLAAPPAVPPVDGAPAYEKLKKLEGNWKAGKDKDARFLSLRVVAGGAAVLETVFAADRTTVLSASIYALDGGELFVTHYGAGGAQPKLKAKALDGGTLRFELVSVGNVKDAKSATHAAALSLVMKDGDTLTQEWLQRAAGRDTKVSIDYTREYVDTLK